MRSPHGFREHHTDINTLDLVTRLHVVVLRQRVGHDDGLQHEQMSRGKNLDQHPRKSTSITRFKIPSQLKQTS